MTKHEFHIALLLLALIIAGVLGYQFANSGYNNKTDTWANALLNSNPDNRNFDIEMEIQPPVFEQHEAEQEASAGKNSPEERNPYLENSVFLNDEEGSLNVSAATPAKTDYHIKGSLSSGNSQANGSYLNSGAHQESISLILGGSSPERITGGLPSIETLLHELPEAIKGSSNDPQRNRIGHTNTQQVVISQLSNENIAIVKGTNAGNYVEIVQQQGDRNVVHLSQNEAGNTAIILQQGDQNRIAGFAQFTVHETEENFSVQESLSMMDVEQTGNFNRADIVQDQSELVMTQHGLDHEFDSNQYESYSDIHQVGYSNQILLEQTESNAAILQDGAGNRVSMRQL